PALLDRARGAGVTVVTTYGMSETGGGCVYNGRLLEGVEITIQAPDAAGAGRILISGPVLAEDYLDTPGHSPAGSPNAGEGFHRSGSTRVLATSDRGRLHPDGRLEVLGRLDDVIITGGVKVEPRHVEEALTCIDGVAEACVVGLPDEQWGSTVVAAVVLETGREPGSPKRRDG
ncbi:AMP-binding enzyme, partial [Actinomyces oris]|uniref:AMP-binding enzyme n=2 Tax=Actinomycetaceae TaxID=2049 RepID=UPI000A630196